MSDSLGGNAKTLMFVNVSPADYNAEETASSLAYALRVKTITNSAERMQESAEVARLKRIISQLRSGGGGNGGAGGGLTPVAEEEEGESDGDRSPAGSVAGLSGVDEDGDRNAGGDGAAADDGVDYSEGPIGEH
jgi:hypothetical protein